MWRLTLLGRFWGRLEIRLFYRSLRYFLIILVGGLWVVRWLLVLVLLGEELRLQIGCLWLFRWFLFYGLNRRIVNFFRDSQVIWQLLRVFHLGFIFQFFLIMRSSFLKRHLFYRLPPLITLIVDGLLLVFLVDYGKLSLLKIFVSQ